ncbi:MAG TPA: fructose-specific PTS transporter subunit EIIC, partial [Longimicrobiaceae bacterium]
MDILAVISSSPSHAHARMAAEALRRQAEVMGHRIRVAGDGNEPGAAEVVIVAGDASTEDARFGVKPVHRVSVAEAIRHTREVIDAAVTLVSPATAAAVSAESPSSVSNPPISTPPESPQGQRLVAITACPTGIAHTFMAAEALQKAAAALGHGIKVETQGSVGAQNALTPGDIAAADAVVIAADTKVDTSRFGGKRVYTTSTRDAIRGGRDVIGAALAQPAGAAAEASPTAATATADAAPARRERTGAYKHLMTGVSWMLPVVIAGGLAIALAFAIGGIHAGDREGTLAWALSRIGGGTAFHLFVAVLSAFIAYSIADRPGLAPGLVGGMLAQELGAGFLGGIASGFIAGYLTAFLARRIRLPATLEGLKPVLILPFVSTLAVGLLMIFVVAPPVHALNDAMGRWLLSLNGVNAAVLGLILGGMMASDMGGPLNKAAYTFAVGL